jgi:hypothetical protein
MTPSIHDQNNRQVINEGKEGDILVYNIKEEWSLFFEFLEVDIPQHIPFPNVNDTKKFKCKIMF